MVLPFQFDEPWVTERLTLRMLTSDDVVAAHRWMSDPDAVRYMLYEPRSLETVAEKVAADAASAVLAKDGDYLQPAIVVNGEVAGTIYFKLTSLDDLTAEIGWVLARDFHGHGYAHEAASAVLDVAFKQLGLRRVFAELDPRNDASATLCRRLGMRHEAHFVEHMAFKGEFADTDIYAILAREWTH